MHETHVTDELRGFACRRCGYRWSVAYQARHIEGSDGDELCLWRRNGLSSMAPEAGLPCPRCNEQLRVTVAPRPADRRGG